MGELPVLRTAEIGQIFLDIGGDRVKNGQKGVILNGKFIAKKLKAFL